MFGLAFKTTSLPRGVCSASQFKQSSNDSNDSYYSGDIYDYDYDDDGGDDRYSDIHTAAMDRLQLHKSMSNKNKFGTSRGQMTKKYKQQDGILKCKKF